MSRSPLARAGGLAAALALSLLPLAGTAGAAVAYETPHIKWLRPTPFAERPRALFFCSECTCAGRYAQELAQRFDLETEVVLVYDGSLVGAGTGAARLEDLLNQPWDAFVFFEDSPTKLLKPYPKLYSIMLFKIARDGAGVVLVDYPDAKVLKEKNRLPAPEGISREPGLAVSCYKVAKGRGVQLQGFDMPSPEFRTRYGYSRTGALVVHYHEGWRDQYDALLRVVGESILWTMGRVLPVFRLAVEDGRVYVEGDWPGKASLRLFATGDGDVAVLRDGAVPPGRRKISAPLPVLAPGSHHLNAIVTRDGRGHSFAVLRHEVPRDAANAISALEFAGGEYAGLQGQTISGTIRYTGAGRPALRLRDPARRILATPPLTAQGQGAAAFAFRLEEWMPSLVTVEATLADASGRLLDRRYEYCNKTIRRERMFEFSAWGHACSHNSVHDLNRRLAELGLTSLMMPGTHMRHSPWGLQAYMLNSAHVYDEIPGRNPGSCFFSEARRKRLTDRFKDYPVDLRTGVRLVSLGDEVQEHYGCFAPDCLRRYQEFLRDKYRGDLAALNRNWKTDYRSWDEVTLSWIPERNQGHDLERYVREFMGNDDRACWNHLLPHYVAWLGRRTSAITRIPETYAASGRAREFWNNEFMDQEAGSFLAGNYPRWLDRQDFKSFAYSETCRFLRDYFHRIDPYVQAGMEGTGGIDFLSHADRMAESQGWMGNYAEANNHNLMNEVHRSITPDDYISNAWVGYTTSPAMLCDRVWNEMFRRPAMIMFYTTCGDLPSYTGILKPDLTPFPAAGEMLRQTEILRAGLGTSLVRSRSVTDPVAVLYSYPSAAFGARVRHGGTFGFARESHNAAMEWIMALGASFRYVTGTRLADGRDSLDGYKVLFLPRVCAVGDGLAAKIRRFVERGGTVVADVRAGIMDEHLNLRTEGAFDDLAGIRRLAVRPAVSQNLPPSLGMERVRLEDGIAAGKAEALWKTGKGVPALLVNRSGKGVFITTNIPFGELPAPAKAPRELLRLLERPLADAASRVGFADARDGAPVYDLRRSEWRNGDMLVLGVKGKPRDPFPLRCRLSSARHVFSIDDGRDLGRVSSFEFRLEPPRPRFFVLTRRPLPAVRQTVPRTVRRGGDLTIVYQVPGMKGERPLRISYERDGRPVELQTVREVCANDRPRKARFRVAVDEPPGVYTLRVRDVYTGRVTVHPLELR